MLANNIPNILPLFVINFLRLPIFPLNRVETWFDTSKWTGRLASLPSPRLPSRRNSKQVDGSIESSCPPSIPGHRFDRYERESSIDYRKFLHALELHLYYRIILDHASRVEEFSFQSSPSPHFSLADDENEEWKSIVDLCATTPVSESSFAQLYIPEGEERITLTHAGS